MRQPVTRSGDNGRMHSTTLPSDDETCDVEASIERLSDLDPADAPDRADAIAELLTRSLRTA